MKPSSFDVLSILVKPSCSRAVLPLPCRLNTRARGVVPVESLGTCTMTVRVNPFTFSDHVVEPGDVVEQPGEDCAAAAVVTPALKGRAPSAISDSVAKVTIPLTRRARTNSECRDIATPFAP